MRTRLKLMSNHNYKLEGKYIRHTGKCRYPVDKIIYWMPEQVRHDESEISVKYFLYR
jgi:hypothetical protein